MMHKEDWHFFVAMEEKIALSPFGGTFGGNGVREKSFLRSPVQLAWRLASFHSITAGADQHADVYTICGELSITPLLHRWALSFTLQVRRCDLNIAPAQLCDKLVRPCHNHSTRGNNFSLYPFRSSSLSGTVSFTNRSPILWNALQSVSGSEISTFSQSKFKKSFLDLLLVYPKFISFTVGDINSCI